ncbi:PrsW family intramembrane metalloprotease [Chloroflexi bacterium TSY]|nr:PrsW family intramembrane metalloprotease [Chloroflexi bacterium TSY]
MFLAVCVGIAIPLIFLYLVRALDLYASGHFTVVVSSFLWGVVAFFLAYQINAVAVRWITISLLVTLVAPIIEELLKSLILIYHVRRTYFTYFVDGAIYGFATGTGFAIFETLFYVLILGGDLGLSLMRSFSTSLMHGSTSALLGVALGRFRFARGLARLIALPIGWGIAIFLHVAFNRTLNQPGGFALQLQAILIGFAGVAATVVFILWGLREEQRWLRETLGLPVGVSAGESAVIQKFANLDQLLAPIGDRFGEQKQEQVESFLRLQARLGIKRKAQELTPTEALRDELAEEIAAMRSEMDELRRTVGVYCMTYVRLILPPESEPLWTQLEETLSETRTPAINLWGTLQERLDR